MASSAAHPAYAAFSPNTTPASNRHSSASTFTSTSTSTASFSTSTAEIPAFGPGCALIFVCNRCHARSSVPLIEILPNILRGEFSIYCNNVQCRAIICHSSVPHAGHSSLDISTTMEPVPSTPPHPPSEGGGTHVGTEQQVQAPSMSFGSVASFSSTSPNPPSLRDSDSSSSSWNRSFDLRNYEDHATFLGHMNERSCIPRSSSPASTIGSSSSLGSRNHLPENIKYIRRLSSPAPGDGVPSRRHSLSLSGGNQLRMTAALNASGEVRTPDTWPRQWLLTPQQLLASARIRANTVTAQGSGQTARTTSAARIASIFSSAYFREVSAQQEPEETIQEGAREDVQQDDESADTVTLRQSSTEARGLPTPDTEEDTAQEELSQQLSASGSTHQAPVLDLERASAPPTADNGLPGPPTTDQGVQYIAPVMATPLPVPLKKKNISFKRLVKKGRNLMRALVSRKRYYHEKNGKGGSTKEPSERAWEPDQDLDAISHSQPLPEVVPPARETTHESSPDSQDVNHTPPYRETTHESSPESPVHGTLSTTPTMHQMPSHSTDQQIPSLEEIERVGGDIDTSLPGWEDSINNIFQSLMGSVAETGPVIILLRV